MVGTKKTYDYAAQRLYVEAPLKEKETYSCTPNQMHYLVNVLRRGVGDDILLFNGYDGEWLAQIQNITKRTCILSIVDCVRGQSYGPDIEYHFAPLKRARLDYMVQKVTELGVAKLCPVVTRRTNTDKINLNRMRANVIEAAEQCGILHIPEIEPPQKLTHVLQHWQGNRSLIFCDEAAATTSPIEVLNQIPKGPTSVLIGPEGGFDEGERNTLLSMPSVYTISLGPRIMRADTAAVAALSLVNAVLGDWVPSQT